MRNPPGLSVHRCFLLPIFWPCNYLVLPADVHRALLPRTRRTHNCSRSALLRAPILRSRRSPPPVPLGGPLIADLPPSLHPLPPIRCLPMQHRQLTASHACHVPCGSACASCHRCSHLVVNSSCALMMRHHLIPPSCTPCPLLLPRSAPTSARPARWDLAANASTACASTTAMRSSRCGKSRLAQHEIV